MRKFLLLSALIYTLFILGLGSLSRGILALSIPLIVYLAIAFLNFPQPPKVQITRSLSAGRVTKDTPVIVKLTITNLGGGLQEIHIVDIVPPPLEVIEGSHRSFTSLAQDQTLELEYTVRGPRGSYTFGEIRITSSERLGIFRHQILETATSRLSILPKVSQLRSVPIRPLQTRGYAGPVPSRQGGSGIDFFGVREYQSGDPLRWINWKLSARHPQMLFTNEFEQERIADVGLILDARMRSEVRLNGDSLFEYAVHATASVANAFLSDGNRVGLLIYGGFLEWVFPGYGKLQEERILQALSRAEPGESLVFDNLDYLPTRFFPARSQIVLISPLFKEDLPILVRLRARGYQLLVISPDPITFEKMALGIQPDTKLAAKIAHMERVLLIRKARQAGIQIASWQVNKPFDQMLLASLGQRPHWYRAVGLEMFQ